MLATLIIVFREVLEAGLVVGIVMAASRGVPRRGLWITGGCAAGVLGAVLVAGFAGEIASAVEGVGQELFNASILLAAVCMLGWHNVWMSRHGRELAADATKIGRDVLDGTRPLYALALVCGIAVLREGSEIVLFLYGIALAGGSSAASMVIGGAFGVVTGRRRRGRDLFRPAFHSLALSVRRDIVADPASGRRHGVLGRGLPGGGGCVALARQ